MCLQVKYNTTIQGGYYEPHMLEVNLHSQIFCTCCTSHMPHAGIPHFKDVLTIVFSLFYTMALSHSKNSDTRQSTLNEVGCDHVTIYQTCHIVNISLFGQGQTPHQLPPNFKIQ